MLLLTWVLGMGLMTASATPSNPTDNNLCKVVRADREACGNQDGSTESYCLGLGCCWDDTTHEHENETHCFYPSVSMNDFKKNEFTTTESFCPNDDDHEYRVGDVDGDNRDDQVCWNKDSSSVTVSFAQNYDTQRGRFSMDACSKTDNTFLLNDVNGDSLSDLVFVDSDGGVCVYEAEKVGADRKFSDQPWRDQRLEFCSSINSKKIFLSLFDVDEFGDLMCLPSGSDESRSLARGDAAGTFMAPLLDPSTSFTTFCTGQRDEARVGDFDGDGRSDVVCREGRGQDYVIALTDGDGFLVNQDYNLGENWCKGDGKSFYVGDFNGDRRADFLCQHRNGKICVRYNSRLFGSSVMFEKTHCMKAQLEFCKDGKIEIGDYNGDGKDDIYCRKDGKTSVSTSVIKPPSVDYIQLDTSYNKGFFCDNRDLFVLDATGNKKQDLFCHDNKGGLMWTMYGDNYGHPVKSSVSKSDNRFCYRDNYHPEYPAMLTGHLKGKDEEDLFCFYQQNSTLQVLEGDSNGKYNGNPRDLRSLDCKVKSIVLGDFDGNSEVDFACQDKQQNTIKVHFDVESTGSQASSLHLTINNWCTGLQSELHVGFFDDDNNADLFCQNYKTGKGSIKYGSSDLTFKEDTTWTKKKSWCKSERGEVLRVGDVNGDGLSDLLCHDSEGNTNIKLNQGVHAEDRGLFGEPEMATLNEFCHLPGEYLYVRDMNGDKLADMICHSSTGEVQISEAHIIYQQPTNNQQQVSGPSCPAPPTPANGEILSGKNSFPAGDTVEFGCKAGYRMFGPGEVTCNDNLQWSNMTSTCEETSCGDRESTTECNPGNDCNKGEDLHKCAKHCQLCRAIAQKPGAVVNGMFGSANQFDEGWVYSHIFANPSLKQIPNDIPTTTTAIYLQWNEIDDIPDNALSGVSECKILNLEGNKLTMVRKAMFEGPGELGSLFLKENEIETIEDEAFEYLSELKTLDLGWNKIAGLTHNMFAGINGVKQLYLQHNKISALTEETFSAIPSLTVLDLSWNQLTEINGEIWNGLALNPLQMDLQYNNITSLDANDLDYLMDNSVVNLEGNQITTVDDVLGRSIITRFTLLLQKNPLECYNNMCRFKYALSSGRLKLGSSLRCADPDTSFDEAMTDVNCMG